MSSCPHTCCGCHCQRLSHCLEVGGTLLVVRPGCLAGRSSGLCWNHPKWHRAGGGSLSVLHPLLVPQSRSLAPLLLLAIRVTVEVGPPAPTAVVVSVRLGPQIIQRHTDQKPRISVANRSKCSPESGSAGSSPCSGPTACVSVGPFPPPARRQAPNLTARAAAARME